MAHTKPKTDITRSLDLARRDLLDLGLRNPLLNYKLLRGKGLDIVDEKPVELFRILVREEKRMSFLPGGSCPLDGNEAGQLMQPEDDAEASPHHTDLRIQTEYSSQQLQSRLLATYRTARTSIEEQGVNTLYLALGMVNWREDDKTEKFYRAPLILVPVTLERSGALDRFHLQYSGEEIGENVSLAEKLKQEYGLKEFPSLPEDEDLDIAAYFQAVGGAIGGRPGWSVDTEAIALGFFSFAKFLMYRDLDPTTWPAPQDVLEHGILQSLFGDGGFQSTAPSYSDDKLLDDQLADSKLVQVVDADSSQTIALLEAIGGHNLVIQGPPGTGKSQTIVNLIAGAVAQGKKVLFVSEKMAALDVVKRRLDKLRLGGPCLELHSNRTNKKSIIEELKRTVSDQNARAPALNSELALLADSRTRLNEYAKAVNEQIGSSGETPRSAFAKQLDAESALQRAEVPVVRLDAAANWTAVDFARQALLVRQVQDRLATSGVPRRHPFWASTLTILLPTEKEQIRTLIARARATAASLDSTSKTLAALCSVAAPSNPTGAAFLCESVKYVLSSPDLTGINTELPEWLSREAEIREILDLGKHYRDDRRQYKGTLRPDAWTRNVGETRQVCAQMGAKWWRFLSGRWRRAKRELASLCLADPPSTQPAQLSLLDAIIRAAGAAARISAAHQLMTKLFPSGWAGLDSDWDLLESQTSWLIDARRRIQQGSLGAWCTGPSLASLDRVEARRQVQEFEVAQKAFSEALNAWTQKLKIDESRFEHPLSSQPFSGLIARWDAQISRIDDLHTLVAINHLIAQCETEGLQAIVPVVSNWDHAGTYLFTVYERARLDALLDRAFSDRPSLASFDGGTHGQVMDQFRRLDLLQLEHDGALLAARHAGSVPKGGGTGEIGLLWREFQKRGRFLPVRTLMMRAGHAIQSIKPVFMMSPLSIANYLPPGALAFDLVVFDEASQVKPVDALGAIARGKQVVVVGDSKQMPPTSFFDSLAASEETEEEEEAAATADIESILGLFCAKGARERMLRWHYRSRHESLITVSNHFFYDNKLVVFPSPARERKALGLVYRHLDDAWYDRGRTRTNPEEAKTVAAAVMAHAGAQLQLPRQQRETLGVAAFSIAQMNAILDQLEVLRRQNPSCEEFFSYPPHEPFFVKNLENVQGDERDVIFISVGYGRTIEGFPTTNFGPLNRAGGERRLNVLISRARRRCEVFTNLRADDIDLSKTGSAGVAALKTFFKYAETGQLDVPAQAGRPPDSEFEEHVRRRLTALGHEVHTQVGSAGFFLDLAVVDPANPGRYLLGIECDGASYHRARSARDRDRLRQAVLEGLGWRIHRIWSTDWFRHPDQELSKVVKAIETARIAGKAAATAPPIGPNEAELPAAVLNTPPETPPQVNPSLPPYECATVSLHLGDIEMHLVDRGQLADLIARVVNIESPVHKIEAARRVLNSAGVQRFGSRIQQTFEEAVDLGVARKLFVLRGEFLWRNGMQDPPVRDRSQLPAPSRKFEFIAPEEIRQAILTIARESCGIAPSEVPGAVCRALGFARATEDMNLAVERHREDLLRAGCLALQGFNLVPIAAPLQR
jgi:very-short-patch-repair endonuclease